MLPKYNYNGARSLILLHERHIKAFHATWKRAKGLNIKLPETTDPDYESLYTLLFHVIRSSRGYITWICEKLELDNPGIDPLPPLENIEDKAEEYINHLLERWALPLVNIEESKFFDTGFKSNWGAMYCIEAMLEHAVMHPIRHEFQLSNLISVQHPL